MFERKPSPVSVAVFFCFAFWLVVVAYYYPYQSDTPDGSKLSSIPVQQNFYDAGFETREAVYARVAREAAREFHIREKVEEFVEKNRLAGAHILEVGSGEGLLQDVVDHYTGLDLSATAKSKYHKPFVQGDARAMPFPDNSFDAAWSIWVLEHVPKPERVLVEIRRVVRPNGLLYLYPAWLCSELAPNGYQVRPYSDFGLMGKLVKASIPIQTSPLFIAMYMIPIRISRHLGWQITNEPTKLRYRAIVPNYSRYWQPDSDAVNSLDMYETFLWFRSRGDECLNCPPESKLIRTGDQPLVIRVHKP